MVNLLVGKMVKMTQPFVDKVTLAAQKCAYMCFCATLEVALIATLCMGSSYIMIDALIMSRSMVTFVSLVSLMSTLSYLLSKLIVTVEKMSRATVVLPSSYYSDALSFLSSKYWMWMTLAVMWNLY